MNSGTTETDEGPYAEAGIGADIGATNTDNSGSENGKKNTFENKSVYIKLRKYLVKLALFNIKIKTKDNKT